VRRLDIASAKLSVVFPEGKLPAIDPNDPAFVLVLGGVEIRGKVNAKAARKLSGGSGRLPRRKGVGNECRDQAGL
jgi:hypothetical protein